MGTSLWEYIETHRFVCFLRRKKEVGECSESDTGRDSQRRHFSWCGYLPCPRIGLKCNHGQRYHAYVIQNGQILKTILHLPMMHRLKRRLQWLGVTEARLWTTGNRKWVVGRFQERDEVKNVRKRGSSSRKLQSMALKNAGGYPKLASNFNAI